MHRTLTTTLPDGTTVNKNTDQDYEYVVALRIRGTWGDFAWCLDESSADTIEADLRARASGNPDYDVAVIACWDADDPEMGIR